MAFSMIFLKKFSLAKEEKQLYIVSDVVNESMMRTMTALISTNSAFFSTTQASEELKLSQHSARKGCRNHKIVEWYYN